MELEDYLWIAAWVIGILAIVGYCIYKVRMMGTVQIMKVGNFYAVRQYACGTGYGGIRFNEYINSEWRWVYGSGGDRASDIPVNMALEEAERVAELALQRYLDHLDYKRHQKIARKKEHAEEKRNKPVLVKTVK